MNKEEIKFFDKIAPTWDANEKMSVAARINPILDMIGIKKGDKVLDLGTGTGVLLPYLSDRVGAEGHIRAVDISTGMLSRAKEKFGSLDNVSFTYLDFEKQPLEGQYDVIMMYCVFPHLADPDLTLLSLYDRNLRHGGKIAIAFPTNERAINHVHHDRKIESGHLPPGPDLAVMLAEVGFDASCLAYSDSAYVVTIVKR